MTISAQDSTPPARPVSAEISPCEAENAAQELLTVFALDEGAWQEFHQLLDAPPRPLPVLQKLLGSKPVWEA